MYVDSCGISWYDVKRIDAWGVGSKSSSKEYNMELLMSLEGWDLLKSDEAMGILDNKKD